MNKYLWIESLYVQWNSKPMRSLVPCFAACITAMMLSGCAQMHYNKTEAAWEKGKAELKGMPVTQLLACAGQPFHQEQRDGRTELRYGYVERMSFASSWCVLSVTAKDGVVVDFNTRSANPGGLTDGSATCGYVFDRCFSDGTLVSEPALGSIVQRMRGDEDAIAGQSYGQSASAAGMAAVVGKGAQMQVEKQQRKEAAQQAAQVQRQQVEVKQAAIEGQREADAAARQSTVRATQQRAISNASQQRAAADAAKRSRQQQIALQQQNRQVPPQSQPTTPRTSANQVVNVRNCVSTYLQNGDSENPVLTLHNSCPVAIDFVFCVKVSSRAFNDNTVIGHTEAGGTSTDRLWIKPGDTFRWGAVWCARDCLPQCPNN